jgi:hypothetical protein
MKRRKIRQRRMQRLRCHGKVVQMHVGINGNPDPRCGVRGGLELVWHFEDEV